MWGAFPLYWPLLEPAGAFEMLGHRIVWSALTLLLTVVLLHRLPALRTLLADRRTAAILAIAAVTITINWATYIYGVTHGRVVETSLGYFINPLVTVLLGVFVLGERLRRLQWVALGVGALAVLVIAVDYGRVPVIALVLACSFGSYGLAKKKANAPAIESLTLETMFVSPLAAAYLVWLVGHGQSSFGHHGVGHALLLASTGIVTAVPLACFSAAATRVPMVTLGLLQYLAPILQFALGVLYFHEAMPAGRWVGFVLVWAALAVFTADSLRHRRQTLTLAAERVPV